MSSPTLVTPMKQIAELYFGALGDGDLSRVPYAADVKLTAPLSDFNPILGREAVLAYLGQFAGKLGHVAIRQIFLSEDGDGMAVEALVGPLHVLDKFVVRNGHIVEQQNFYDPRPVLDAASPGGLTRDERSLLLDRMRSSREAVRHAVSDAAEIDFSVKTAAEEWSALETLEHLVVTEEALLGLIQNRILATDPNPALPAELQGKDGMVVSAMENRANKVKTFEFLLPAGRYHSGQAALDAFLARRAATEEFVRSTSAALHYHAAPLEGLGSLDAYQWLLLMAAHTDRHLHQFNDAVERARKAT